MKPNLTAYVLAKDEAPNIGRCLEALRACEVRVVVLDSGSSDSTVEIARAGGATVEDYGYTTHLAALREICEQRTPTDETAMVLDADMIVTEALIAEAQELIDSAVADVVIAPISMSWEGRELNHASLCPPKAFMFRGGRNYFQAAGHGESLREGVKYATTRARLVHDDRKPYTAYLQSQCRYAGFLLERAREDKLTWRDRIRLRSPLLAMIVPLTSLIAKAGFLDGSAGVGYAMDRLIAEAIQYRQALAARVSERLRTEEKGSRGSQKGSALEP